jgi:hypothetical protein
MGRDNLVADLVGEKLNETFAREALTTAFSGEEGMSFLVPVSRVDAASFYVCVTDSAEACREPAVCAARLDAELQRAFHYRQARLLGQLGPLQVRFAPDARERYERLFVRRGMKWGDIKYAAVVATQQPRRVSLLSGFGARRHHFASLRRSTSIRRCLETARRADSRGVGQM